MTPLVWILAAFYLVNGAVMIALPEWWYGATPGVSDAGPYNAHFVVDIGIASGVSGATMAWGAFGAGWRLVLAGATFPAGHALFHIVELLHGEAQGPLYVHVFGVIVPAAATLLSAWFLTSKEA